VGVEVGLTVIGAHKIVDMVNDLENVNNVIELVDHLVAKT
jgi:hypothetical protein